MVKPAYAMFLSGTTRKPNGSPSEKYTLRTAEGRTGKAKELDGKAPPKLIAA